MKKGQHERTASLRPQPFVEGWQSPLPTDTFGHLYATTSPYHADASTTRNRDQGEQWLRAEVQLTAGMESEWKWGKDKKRTLEWRTDAGMGRRTWLVRDSHRRLN
jgi:hypothetical protein